jgi:hypothetical protein
MINPSSQFEKLAFLKLVIDSTERRRDAAENKGSNETITL